MLNASFLYVEDSVVSSKPIDMLKRLTASGFTKEKQVTTAGKMLASRINS